MKQPPTTWQLKTQQIKKESFASYPLEELKKIRNALQDAIGRVTTGGPVAENLRANLRAVDEAIAEKEGFGKRKPESEAGSGREKLADELRLIIEVIREGGAEGRLYAGELEKKLEGTSEEVLRGILEGYVYITRGREEAVRKAEEAIESGRVEEAFALVGRFREIVVGKFAEEVLKEAQGVWLSVSLKGAGAESGLRRLKAYGHDEEKLRGLQRVSEAWNERAKALKELIDRCGKSKWEDLKDAAALRELQEKLSAAYGALIADALLAGKLDEGLRREATALLKELKDAMDSGEHEKVIGMKEGLRRMYERCMEGLTQP